MIFILDNLKAKLKKALVEIPYHKVLRRVNDLVVQRKISVLATKESHNS